MVITFIGHREVFEEEKVRKWVRNCILSQKDSEMIFFCGGCGAFDLLCARVCSELKSELEKSEIVYVTPYLDRCADQPLLYDTVLYPSIEDVPLRWAIIKRNRYMIENADLVIAYIRHSFGGAYQSYLFAKRKGKRILRYGE